MAVFQSTRKITMSIESDCSHLPQLNLQLFELSNVSIVLVNQRNRCLALVEIVYHVQGVSLP